MVATAIAWVIANQVIIQAALTIASISYQIVQAKKMRKAARDAAEARKGYEFPVEGSIQPVPIVYGRAKVGGVRVYHNVSSNFIYTSPNSNKVYDLGASSTLGETYTYDVEGNIETVTTVTNPSGNLSRNISGSKNEFLFFQQVLCQGPINAIHDFVVDESRYLDDTSLSKDKAALRIDIHYDGNVADNIISANFPERKDSKFPNLAYANAIIRLDRDKAQFGNSVPMLQFFIEGRKVKTVTNGVLSTNRVYSNNPAWCLLDYLLFDASRYNAGKSLTVEQIDLDSFEQAAALCNTTVAQNKLTAGKIWRNTDGSRDIQSRNIPLYECNAIIDVTKPLRENVESILSTMGDARLVWSQGKYKLLLQYPSSNQDIELSAVITDNDLILGESIDVNWPDSSQRLNHCTIRFHNEAENFAEDTVSWPPKSSGTYFKGVGGKRYSLPTDSWEETHDGAKLLAAYGVWDGASSSSTMSWLLRVKNTGTYTLEYTADDSINITISDGVNSQTFSGSNWKVKYSSSISLTQNVEYTITINATDNGGRKGAAARLVGPDLLTVWTTRSVSYDAYQEIQQSSAIYDAMFAEDSNIELETDMFLDGCTDFYHALAKAEELVRTSRTALGVSFSYNVKNIFLEPGDIIQLQSEFVSLGESTPLYLRVNEVNMNDNGTCKVTGTRFDYTQLAWNVADDEYIEPPNLYQLDISAPFGLEYSPVYDKFYYGSSGKLTWENVNSDGLTGYVVYMNTINDFDSQGNILFKEIGRVKEPPFYLPALGVTSAIFGVRSLSTSNKLSDLVTTGNTAIVLSSNLPRSVTIQNTTSTFIQIRNSNSFYNTTIVLEAIPNNYVNPVYVWKKDTIVVPNENNSSLTVIAFDVNTSHEYSVEVKENGDSTSNSLSTYTVKLFSIQEGNDAINVELSQPNANIPSNSDGTIFTLNGFSGLVQVLRGTTNVISSSTLSIVNGTLLNNIYSKTQNNLKLSLDISTGVYTLANETTTWNTDKEDFVIRVEYDGSTIDKTFTVSKVKQGIQGPQGPSVEITGVGDFAKGIDDVFRPATKELSANVQNITNPSYVWTVLGGNLNTLTGATVILTPVEDLITVTLTVTGDNISGSIIKSASFAVILDGSVGANGYMAAFPTIYQWNTVVPTRPSTNSTYTWASGIFTAPSGWYTSIPADTTPGKSLWSITIPLNAIATQTTTELDWTNTSYAIRSIAFNGLNGSPGISPLSGILTNESHVVSANLNGLGYTLTGAGGTFKVFQGTTDVTSSSAFGITGGTSSASEVTKVQNGLTLTINKTTGVYSLSGTSWTTDQETFNLTTTYSSVTIEKVYTISKSKTGLTGNNAVQYYIETTAPVIYKDAPDAITAGVHQNITVTGKRINGTATETFGYLTITANGETEASTATANSITTSISNSAGKTLYTVKLYSAANKTGLLDTQTIPVVFKGNTGQNALSGVLTNENATIAANSSGSGYSLTGTGGTFLVYSGNSQVSASFSIVGGTDVGTTQTKTQSGLTLTLDETTGAYTLSGSAWTTSSESFTLRAIYAGQTIDKVYTISKAIAGITPSNGVNAVYYYIDSSSPVFFKDAPDAATDGTYTSVIVTGKKVDGATTSTFGFLTATANGATEASTATPNSITISPASNSDKSSYTVKLYDTSTKTTLLDTQTIPVVFKGATGSKGDTGNTGAAGSASFIINRGASNVATAPTDAEVIAAVGRSPILGDLAIIQYNNENNSTQYQRTLTGWVLKTSYITGNLIVENTITASKLSVTSLSSVSANIGQLNIGTTGSLSSGIAYGSDGIFLGYSTDNYKFSVGKGTQKISFDGTNLTVSSITIDGSGRISGIGTGNNTYVNNSLVETNSFVSSSNVSISGNYIIKTGQTTDWDAHAYSKESFVGGAYVSFVAQQTNAWIMAGLNIDPTTNASYSSIDYAIYLVGDGTLRIYESGSDRGQFGTYSINDVFNVAYDGTRIRYYKNGSVLREVIVNITNALYFDSSFYSTNGAISKVKFGPLSSNNWSSIGNIPTTDIYNNQISIASNGTLSGAGGGQVTISGLGYTGDLAATKNIVYRQTSQPSGTAHTINDIWIDTDAIPTIIYNWNGSSWSQIGNYTTNTNQLTDGAGLGTTALWPNVTGTGKPADGATKNIVYRQATEPTGTAHTINDIWIDTDATPTVIYNWNGSTWSQIGNYTTNTNQLTDGAGLGTKAVWDNVTGTGKPENNANKTYVDTEGKIQGVSSGAGTAIKNSLISISESNGTVTLSNAGTGSFVTITANNKISATNIGTYFNTLAIGETYIKDAAISSAKIVDAAITNAKIGNAAITSAKIADAAITNAKIGNAAITSAKIGDLEVNSAKIANLTVGTGKITNNAVTESVYAVLGIDAYFHLGTYPSQFEIDDIIVAGPISVTTGDNMVVLYNYDVTTTTSSSSGQTDGWLGINVETNLGTSLLEATYTPKLYDYDLGDLTTIYRSSGHFTYQVPANVTSVSFIMFMRGNNDLQGFVRKRAPASYSNSTSSPGTSMLVLRLKK